MKPIKIKLNNNSASGMYILLEDDEIKYTKDGETKPPNRAYKIQIEVEASYNNKRCRGKKTFTVAKRTSIITAVDNLLGKRNEMKHTLKAKGTLKAEKKIFKKVDTTSRKFKAVFESWIAGKKLEIKPSTITVYESFYNSTLSKLDNKVIDTLTEDDIQNLVNDMITQRKKPSTIRNIKLILRPLLELNDVFLNWRKIKFQKVDNERGFKGTDEDAVLIAKTLLEYPHPIVRGVFTFLLSGRRIGETMKMKHSDINYKANTFTLPAENTKTNTEVTYELNPALIQAISSQKTTKGIIFNMKPISIHYHFKKAMKSIGIFDMVMHDIRSMVATVALRNSADIYSVSKMLSHKKLTTTQARYLGDDVSQATEAQSVFNTLVDAIDVEVIHNEPTALKQLYPHLTDKQIQSIINFIDKVQND